MDISFNDKKTYLFVSCTGKWEPSAVSETLKSIRDHATQLSRNLILVDWRGVEKPESEFYRYLAGQDVAEILKPFKTAALYPKELRTKFTENTAVNRGARFLVFSDEESALDWLLDRNLKIE